MRIPAGAPVRIINDKAEVQMHRGKRIVHNFKSGTIGKTLRSFDTESHPDSSVSVEAFRRDSILPYKRDEESDNQKYSQIVHLTDFVLLTNNDLIAKIKVSEDLPKF